MLNQVCEQFVKVNGPAVWQKRAPLLAFPKLFERFLPALSGGSPGRSRRNFTGCAATYSIVDGN
jgi:hypothetical protein